MTFPLPGYHHAVYGVSTNCRIDFWIVLWPLASLQRSPAACRHVPRTALVQRYNDFQCVRKWGMASIGPEVNGRAEQVRSLG
jgi:hypothetical protein